MTTKTVFISFLGIDKRSRSAYEIFFKKINKLDCVLTDDHSKAQICLVDMDAYNIQEQYQALTLKYPALIMLILSLSFYDCQQNTEFFIRKPVKRDSLQDSLNQIYNHFFQAPVLNTTKRKAHPASTSDTTDFKFLVNKPITEKPGKKSATKVTKVTKTKAKAVPIQKNKPHSTANAGKLLKVENEEHFVGEQGDIDIENPEQLKTIFYSPGKFFQSVIEQASLQSRQSGKIIQVNFLNHDFYFDYEEQKVYSTVGPGIIRPLCLLSLENKPHFTPRKSSFRNELHKIIQTNKHKTQKKSLEKQSWSMESFMWLISLWTSRGRIPQGTDILKPVFLMEWPNLTRLASIPHAVRIAALLYNHPYPLPRAAQLLGIEQRYVFAFYSACKAIGVANVSRRQIDHTFAAEPPEEHKNKSILSKLLSRLKGFADN